jgi:hypothetical protein
MFTPIKNQLTHLTAFLFVIGFTFSSMAMQSPNTDTPVEAEETEIPTFRFEDQALINFFDLNKELSEINKATQDKMAEAAQKYDLTLERFNQIASANKIGALQGGAFTDAEVEAFTNLGPEISQIQREQQQEIQSALGDKGFTSATYQEILTEYRTDQDLQAHVRELLRERRKQEILEERRRAAEEEKANEESGK